MHDNDYLQGPSLRETTMKSRKNILSFQGLEISCFGERDCLDEEIVPLQFYDLSSTPGCVLLKYIKKLLMSG
jgi:hypothetical protein